MEDRVRYTKPEVVDYGSLVELTADIEHLNLSAGMLQAVAGAVVLSQPMIPGGDGGVVATQGSAGGGGADPAAVPAAGGGELPGDAGGTLDDPAVSGGDGDAGGGAGASEGGGGAGEGGAAAAGRLPFTGFSVFLVAVLGAGMAAAGASLRARLRRAR